LNPPFVQVAQRIKDELIQLEKVVERVKEAWQLFQESPNSIYLDSVALNLHGFYNGLERLFEMIAIRIDNTPPSGVKWHQTLLQQMVVVKDDIRPAVISTSNREVLDNYRGFRHVVRHTYAIEFDVEQMEPLVEALTDVFVEIRAELLVFADFLES
jgi:uncharacterized protein YutE (UPF0331/DUF86 family)